MVLLVLLAPPAAGRADQNLDLVEIPGDAFTMGDAEGEPDETPRRAAVGPFRLMRHEVTNRQFAAFVEETGRVTDPEARGFGYVWDGAWSRVNGADWRHPFGPDSSIVGRPNHPVVQVSQRDAAAFCAHHGLWLPTEAEWEFAARGADDDRRYPWGDAPPEDEAGERRANFGAVRCCAASDEDGHAQTAPVGRFPAGASPFDVLDMAGNVWEWTASPYRGAGGRPGFVALKGGGWGNDPYGLRIGYRHGNPPDIGLNMVGFRCAGDG